MSYVWGLPGGDPWVLLTAAAMVTRKLRLGTSVTPLPRRRPQVLAQTLATLDRLSNGRVVLGAGLGGVAEGMQTTRAAYELDPEVDTIIEIGGQDAKFTTLRDGRVTSAVMNTVCAAGTGSSANSHSVG